MARHDCQLPVSSFEPESCWALRAGHPHFVRAGDSTARCGHAGGVKDTYLCVPVLAQGEALSILDIQATDQDPELGEAKMSFQTTFASQVGLSVANIRLREALQAQSTKDPLKGLYNRRYLQKMLEREIRRATRSEQDLGVLMLDLDHFKNFNDTYGHEAGDAVLREAGSFLVRSVRAELRLPLRRGRIRRRTAYRRSARRRGPGQHICAKLRDLVVMHDGRPLGLITASIGVAALPIHGINEKDLLQAADAALYRAKREGRDRCRRDGWRGNSIPTSQAYLNDGSNTRYSAVSNSFDSTQWDNIGSSAVTSSMTGLPTSPIVLAQSLILSPSRSPSPGRGSFAITSSTR